MDKVNKQELRRLAEAATPGPWWIDSHGHSMVSEAKDHALVFRADDRMGPAVRHPETQNLSHWPNDWDASFIASANPAAILSLLDECDGLMAQHSRDSAELRALCQARDETRRERDQLRAELEQYRKDAERMRRALEEVHLRVDGDIRPTVRDIINGMPDANDIYDYCDDIEGIIDAALAKEGGANG